MMVNMKVYLCLFIHPTVYGYTIMFFRQFCQRLTTFRLSIYSPERQSPPNGGLLSLTSIADLAEKRGKNGKSKVTYPLGVPFNLV